MKLEKWIDKNTESLKGKTIAVSGSTGGLGRYICSFVANLGGNLILLDRNDARSKSHAEELKTKFGIYVKSIIVDMVDINSVKNACELLKEEKLDFLILNAGAYSLPREKSREGYDQVFQINFVSPYYIVRELLYLLKQRCGKVVVVGSIAHKYSHINENDIDFSAVRAPRKVYGNAKRYLMFSLFELFKNEKDISLSIAHPGITPTNITSHYPKWISGLIKYPMKWIFTSPKKASLNIIKAMFKNCPYYTWVGPSKFNIWGKPKLKKLQTCSQEEGEKIFEIAEKIYNKIKNKKINIHQLGLQPEYYDLIKSGQKIYEGRLNDEKRSLIEVGDYIEIQKDPTRKESFKVKVVDKLFFKSFFEMAQTLRGKDIGFENKKAEEIADVYRKFYSQEKENKYGVVAIKVELID